MVFIVLTGCLLLVIIGLALARHRTPRQDNKTNSGVITFSASPAAAPQSQEKTSTQGQISPTNPSNSSITNVVKTESIDPSLKSGGFTIVSSEQVVSGWYLVTVSAAGGPNEFIVLRQNGATLTLVSEPSLTSSANDLQTEGVPQAVQDKMLAQNE